MNLKSNIMTLALLRWREKNKMLRGANMKTDKQTQWQGYFDGFWHWPERQGVDSRELLHKGGVEGKQEADGCVLPFISKNSQVLEIAAGLGRISRFVAPACRQLTCTDIHEQSIQGLRQNLAICENVRVEMTNGYDLGTFASESFDCVYSFSAFFHMDLELVVNYFTEIARVLNPGGVGILQFKDMKAPKDLQELLEKITSSHGLARYEHKLDKWRYIALENLELLCRHNDLDIVDPRVEHFTFAKRCPANDTVQP